MAFKAEHCQAWVQEQAQGARFVSYLVTGTATTTNPAPVAVRSGITFSGPELLREVAAGLGLDEAAEVGLLVETTFLALTDHQVFYGSRSSVRNRPKDLLRVAPAAGFSLHWVDDDRGSGNRFRHLLLDFGDGAWRIERIGLTALNKDLSPRTNLHQFFEVLGDRAHHLEA